jgi:GT2 family glycosyltransferase
MLQTYSAQRTVADRLEGAETPLRLAVGIATAGRPTILAKLLKRLSIQSRRPDVIVVSAPDTADIAGAADASPGVVLLTGARGLARQRNTILAHLVDYDTVVFFDDDFVPCDGYLAEVERIMIGNPDVVMTTGRVIEDGILGPGVSFEAALTAIERAPHRQDGGTLAAVYNGYGCNMSVRLATARAAHIGFDVRLPLYGWLEDVDFSRRLAPYGKIVRSDATRGVHLGVKLGRQPGLKLGYSQIANPLYLLSKGTLTPGRALRLMSRNIAMNMLRCLRPEPWVDRPGRLRGNARGLLDLSLGRLNPARIETF